MNHIVLEYSLCCNGVLVNGGTAMETKGCNLATKSDDRGCVVRIAISDPSWLSSRVRGFLVYVVLFIII